MDDELKQVIEDNPPAEPEEKQPKQRSKKVVRVNIISRNGPSVLVEYIESQAVQRKTVPADVLDGNKIAQDDLDLGVPYGIPWADLIKINITPKAIEKALHNAGIWTLEDVIANTKRAIGALQTAYHVDIAALIRAANEYLAK